MSDKKKKELAKKLGSGGSRQAANAMINRHKMLDYIVGGSYGAEKPKKKK